MSNSREIEPAEQDDLECPPALRLAHESAKLDSAAEQALANERLISEQAWPEYED